MINGIELKTHLSFTLINSKGNSIVTDIKFLIRNFDQRICNGFDFPEFSISKLSVSFNLFSIGKETAELKNITLKNG